jgi:hypothetical protein
VGYSSQPCCARPTEAGFARSPLPGYFASDSGTANADRGRRRHCSRASRRHPGPDQAGAQDTAKDIGAAAGPAPGAGHPRQGGVRPIAGSAQDLGPVAAWEPTGWTPSSSAPTGRCTSRGGTGGLGTVGHRVRGAGWRWRLAHPRPGTRTASTCSCWGPTARSTTSGGTAPPGAPPSPATSAWAACAWVIRGSSPGAPTGSTSSSSAPTAPSTTSGGTAPPGAPRSPATRMAGVIAD